MGFNGKERTKDRNVVLVFKSGLGSGIFVVLVLNTFRS